MSVACLAVKDCIRIPPSCVSFRPLRWEEDLKSSRLAVAGRPSLACLLPREFAGQPARRH